MKKNKSASPKPTQALIKAVKLYRKKFPGYHLDTIPRGLLGESSKLLEEVLELQDAEKQKVRIMQQVELSDLYGAMELYLKKNFPELTMEDLKAMSQVTQRAFKNGRR